jgi:hypothetical protein
LGLHNPENHPPPVLEERGELAIHNAENHALEERAELSAHNLENHNTPDLGYDFPHLPAHLQARAKEEKGLGVHLACHDANFTGTCNVYHEPHGECHNYEAKNWDK